MNILVIGAGICGSACVFDLAKQREVKKIFVADRNASLAKEVAEKFGNHKADWVEVDAGNRKAIFNLMTHRDCVISAVPYRFNLLLAETAVAAHTNFCDLGGNDEVLLAQLSLKKKAKIAGVTIVPNCGLAPGLANIIAVEGSKRFDKLNKIKLRVGGLPQKPIPPFNYQLVFSVEGLVNEYIEPAKIIRNFKVKKVKSLTGIEPIEFDGLGPLESFYTSGGSSTLPEYFEGKVNELDYKTIRYQGHCKLVKSLFKTTKSREEIEEKLSKDLPKGDADLVLLRVTIDGIIKGEKRRLVYELIDYFDPKTNMSAMMRTTSFPTSIIALMLAKNEIKLKGVYTPEQCVPYEKFISELIKRGFNIQTYCENK